MLDPETVHWYRTTAQKEIDRLTHALRKEQTEEETRMLRARIKAMEAVASWKWEAPSNDAEIEFL